MADAGREVVIRGDTDGVNLQADEGGWRKGREKRRGEGDKSRVGKSRVRKIGSLRSRKQGHSSESEPGMR